MKDLTEIIRRPVVTERSTSLKAYNQYVFEVHPVATKAEIRQAIENLFRVNVRRVRTMSVHGKLSRRMGKNAGLTSDWKKAIVKLAPGQEIKAAEE